MPMSTDFIIMKFPIISTVVVSLCALVSTVRAELKVASINQGEVISSFHKTFAMRDRLQKQLTTIQEEIKVRQEKLAALKKEDEKICQRLDPSLTDAARRKVQEEHNAKLNEIQAMEQDLRSHAQRREAAFKEIQLHELSAILKEVQENIDTIAAEKGVDLLIDSSAISSATGIPMRTFPYVKPTMDITPDVIQTLNRTAPAGFNLEAELQKARNASGAPAGN